MLLTDDSWGAWRLVSAQRPRCDGGALTRASPSVTEPESFARGIREGTYPSLHRRRGALLCLLSRVASSPRSVGLRGSGEGCSFGAPSWLPEDSPAGSRQPPDRTSHPAATTVPRSPTVRNDHVDVILSGDARPTERASPSLDEQREGGVLVDHGVGAGAGRSARPARRGCGSVGAETARRPPTRSPRRRTCPRSHRRARRAVLPACLRPRARRVRRRSRTRPARPK
jgi:hypothetical protein